MNNNNIPGYGMSYQWSSVYLRSENTSVFAENFRGYNLPELKKVCPEIYQRPDDVHAIFIKGLDQVWRVAIGDFIIKIGNEFCSCNEKVFSKLFTYNSPFSPPLKSYIRTDIEIMESQMTSISKPHMEQVRGYILACMRQYAAQGIAGSDKQIADLRADIKMKTDYYEDKLENFYKAREEDAKFEIKWIYSGYAVHGNIYICETYNGEIVRLFYSDKEADEKVRWTPRVWHRLDQSGKNPTENVLLPVEIKRYLLEPKNINVINDQASTNTIK